MIQRSRQRNDKSDYWFGSWMHQRLNSCKDDFWGSRSLPSDAARCCFWHQGGRGRSQCGRGCRGWLLLAATAEVFSLSSFFRGLSFWFLCSVGWMKWTNGLRERTNHNPPYCLWESLPVLRVVKCLWRVNELLMFLQNQTTQQECVHTSVLSTRSTSAGPLKHRPSWHHQNRCWTHRRTRLFVGGSETKSE